MTNAERFERACRYHGLGIREDIEKYPNVPSAPAYARTRHVAEELIASARQHLPRLRPIFFDFIHDPTVNAWAFRHNDDYFIGVTSGTLLMLHLVMEYVMASPKTLPGVGNPSEEVDISANVDWSVLDVQVMHAAGVRGVQPKDPVRQFYTAYVAEEALLFVIGHEIAHITRGHVDYWSAKTGSAFAELGFRGSEAENIERQALETDADGRSVFARCFSTNLTEQSANGQAPPWMQNTVSENNWHFGWGFGVNTLFRLFGDKGFSSGDLSAGGYPPLPLRQVMAMSSATMDLIGLLGEEQGKKIAQELWKGIGAADDSFVVIGASTGTGGTSNAMKPMALQHIERITDCWNHLVDKLQPYSMENLHPKRFVQM